MLIITFNSFLPFFRCFSFQVILEYEDMASAMKARNALHGRKFEGRTVIGTYLPEDKYIRGEFDASV